MKNSWQTWFIPPKINSNEIHIWRSNLFVNEDLLASYLKTLSNNEISRANSFYFKKDKISFIAARGILRDIISRYTKLKPKDIQFVYSKFGKPYLTTAQNNQKLYFNVAHSNDYGIYAFTKNVDIGVDIELYQNISNLAEVAECIFSNSEYKKLRNLTYNKKHDYFYTLWTAKESFVKALGLGLSYDLQQIRKNYPKVI